MVNLVDWPVLGAGIAVGAFGVLKALSPLIAVINPRGIRCWFGEAGEVVSRSGALQGRLRELEALGFRLLGVKHEKLPLWGRHGWEVATSSPQTNTFASIVLTEKGEPFIVYFFTPLAEGGFVYTRQQSRLAQLESENISVKNVASNSLDDLFHSHVERVEAFKQKGFHPVDVESMASRIEATYTFYSSIYAKKIMASTILFISLPYFIVAFLLLRTFRK